MDLRMSTKWGPKDPVQNPDWGIRSHGGTYGDEVAHPARERWARKRAHAIPRLGIRSHKDKIIYFIFIFFLLLKKKINLNKIMSVVIIILFFLN